MWYDLFRFLRWLWEVVLFPYVVVGSMTVMSDGIEALSTVRFSCHVMLCFLCRRSHRGYPLSFRALGLSKLPSQSSLLLRAKQSPPASLTPRRAPSARLAAMFIPATQAVCLMHRLLAANSAVTGPMPTSTSVEHAESTKLADNLRVSNRHRDMSPCRATSPGNISTMVHRRLLLGKRGELARWLGAVRGSPLVSSQCALCHSHSLHQLIANVIGTALPATVCCLSNRHTLPQWPPHYSKSVLGGTMRGRVGTAAVQRMRVSHREGGRYGENSSSNNASSSGSEQTNTTSSVRMGGGGYTMEDGPRYGLSACRVVAEQTWSNRHESHGPHGDVHCGVSSEQSSYSRGDLSRYVNRAEQKQKQEVAEESGGENFAVSAAAMPTCDVHKNTTARVGQHTPPSHAPGGADGLDVGATQDESESACTTRGSRKQDDMLTSAVRDGTTKDERSDLTRLAQWSSRAVTASSLTGRHSSDNTDASGRHMGGVLMPAQHSGRAVASSEPRASHTASGVVYRRVSTRQLECRRARVFVSPIASISAHHVLSYQATRQKVLVVDLDETLCHVSTSTANMSCAPSFSEVIPTAAGAELFHVWERPYVRLFLATMAKLFNLVLFTSASKPYADTILAHIDPHGYLKRRFYRQDCRLLSRQVLGKKETTQRRRCNQREDIISSPSMDTATTTIDDHNSIHNDDEADSTRNASSYSANTREVTRNNAMDSENEVVAPPSHRRGNKVLVKDLRILKVPSELIVVVDNCEECLLVNRENAIIIKPFIPSLARRQQPPQQPQSQQQTGGAASEPFCQRACPDETLRDGGVLSEEETRVAGEDVRHVPTVKTECRDRSSHTETPAVEDEGDNDADSGSGGNEDEEDVVLLALIPFLEALLVVPDVRSILRLAKTY